MVWCLNAANAKSVYPLDSTISNTLIFCLFNKRNVDSYLWLFSEISRNNSCSISDISSTMLPGKIDLFDARDVWENYIDILYVFDKFNFYLGSFAYSPSLSYPILLRS